MILREGDILSATDSWTIRKDRSSFICLSKNGSYLCLGHFDDSSHFYDRKIEGKFGFEWEVKNENFDLKNLMNDHKPFQSFKFLIDEKDHIIELYEEVLIYGHKPFCAIYKVSKFNRNLDCISCRVLDFEIDTDFKFILYSYDNNYYLVHQKSINQLIISSLDGYGGRKHKYIENVSNWDIAHHQCGNLSFFYPYLIIRKEEKVYEIWSFIVYKSIIGNFNIIIPSSFRLKRENYRRDKQVYYDDYESYLCIDNHIYNDHLELCPIKDQSLKFHLQNANLIDVCADNVAYSKDGELFLLNVSKLIHPAKSPWEKQIIEFIYSLMDYKIKELNGKYFLLFSVKYGLSKNSTIVAFDLGNKMFIIKPNEEPRNRFETHEHYSIWDALDGDPEAYWNID